MTTDKNKDETAAPEMSDEDRTRAAMGKGPAGSNDATGNARTDVYVPAPGGDPDSIARIVKSLPEELRDRVGVTTPEELADARRDYAEKVNAARNPRGNRAALEGLSDEEKANVTGQPIGDGKSTGAPSADDPGSALREGKLTADDDKAATTSTAAAQRAAVGASTVKGRRAAGSQKDTTEEK